MAEILLFLNQPVVLWTLFTAAIILVLIDYLFPVDWPAFVGYVLFALFIGATIPAGPLISMLAIVVVVALMIILHISVFSKFLTNAPKYERVAGDSNSLANDAEADENEGD